MQLTIPKAAKLYGKHRSTIHRHIEAGRLSCGFRGDGTRVVEMAELVRCYGEPDQLPPEMQPSATNEKEWMQQAMLHALQAMHQELVALREEVSILGSLPSPTSSDKRSPLHDQPKASDEFTQKRATVVSDKSKDSPTNNNNDPHGLRSLARALFQDSDKN